MNVPGTVGDILGHKRPEVWSVAPDSTVFQAIEMMADKNVGALPVLDGNRLVGIISERDYTRKVVLKGRASRETPVRDIISRDLSVAALDDTIVECMRVMTERKVRHLPVLDGQELVGIISIGDLVNWIISAQTSAIDQLEKYITGEYPACEEYGRLRRPVCCSRCVARMIKSSSASDAAMSHRSACGAPRAAPAIAAAA